MSNLTVNGVNKVINTNNKKVAIANHPSTSKHPAKQKRKSGLRLS